MNTIQDNVIAAHAFMDVFMQHIEKKSGKVTCKAECAHCCLKEPIYSDLAETEVIVASLSQEQKEKLKPRVESWWNIFHEKEFHKEISNPDEDPKDFTFLMAYRKANLPCPLLDLKTGLCSVYPLRPNGCRSHAALKSTTKNKKDNLRPDQRFIIFSDETSKILWAETFSLLSQDLPTYFFEMDHLGVWLGKLLLGKTTSSAMYKARMVHLT
jgi:Fe-S-cluster containining protein